MGNFQIVGLAAGEAIEKVSDVSLLGLSGRLCGRKYKFLLDSGASCNFVGLSQLSALDIDHDLVVSQQVRLADGTMLKTCGQVDLRVEFGGFTYKGKFFVLDAQIPLILGMQFFQDVAPKVDWKSREVSVDVNGKKVVLPVVRDIEKSMCTALKSRPCAVTRVKNSFDGLKVFNGDDDVGAKLPGDQASDLAVAPIRVQKLSGKRKTCKQCGCYLGGDVVSNGKCRKCENASFVHVVACKNKSGSLRNASIQPEHAQRGGSVKGQGVLIPSPSSSVRRARGSTGKGLDQTSVSGNSDVELVGLRQFVRGGKTSQYLNFGVIMLNSVEDD